MTTPDFGMPPALAVALANALLFPAWLLVLARLPGMQERNALQFLIAAIVTVAVSIVCLATSPHWHGMNAWDLIVALMALGSAFILYLQIWGLLSRGYTLGILITLLRAGRPLTAADVMAQYRGGDGLQWIMAHRLAGMTAAGVVRIENDRISLTPGKGMMVARLYRFAIGILGLRRTG